MIFVNIYTGIFVIASLVIQSHSSFDVLRVAGVKPDLLFIVIIYTSYTFGSFYGEVTGFISGILQDAASNSPLGMLAFPKVALGFIVGMFGRTVIKNNIIAVLLLLFAASLVKGIILIFLGYIFYPSMVSSVLGVIIPESFYNAILAPPLFFIFDKIYRKEIERLGSV